MDAYFIAIAAIGIPIIVYVVYRLLIQWYLRSSKRDAYRLLKANRPSAKALDKPSKT